jgi:hypothetical protein
MQALPVPPFTRKKCYRELITRIIKEGHNRWKHRNTQLSESGELTPHLWSPKPRTLTTLPSPHKRKRDVAWSTQRITETTMQKILHNFTYTAHTHTEDTTETTSSAPDDGSGGGGSGSLGKCGDREGEAGAVGGGSAEIQPTMELLTPHIQTGLGSGGEERAGGIVACRVRGTVVLPVPVTVSSARPPPANDRRLDMDTQAEHRSRPTRRRVDTVTARIAQQLYRQKDITQSLQYAGTVALLVKLHCTVVGMEIIETNLFKN